MNILIFHNLPRIFCLNHNHIKFKIVIAVVVASVVFLGPGMRFIADMHYRLEIAYEEFQQTKVERDGCLGFSPSCRSLSQRFEDAWLGFNSGRNKNPLLLYKKYRDFLR